MKVGIVTFQETNNYGALLQNYALQKAIKDAGHSCDTIDYKSSYIGRPLGFAHLKNKGLKTYLLGVAGYLIYLPRSKRNRFFRKNISYSPKMYKEDLEELNDTYDMFICGSDQVWNYKLTGDDPYYFMDFVKDKNKCVSFAASLGLNEIDDKHKGMFIHYLSEYKYLSAREESASKLVGECVKRDIETVPDPCMLLDASEWEAVSLRPLKRGYVYVYQLGVSKDVVLLAKKIAKEKKLEIIYTPFPVGSMSGGEYRINAGAQDVLGFIRDAEYVITDSFHGTLLSIIMNKQFFTKCSGTHAGVGNRIHDLLTRYGLTNRLLSGELDYTEDIDYSSLNDKLNEDRENAKNILYKIMNN